MAPKPHPTIHKSIHQKGGEGALRQGRKSPVSRNSEARPETSTSYTTDRNLKLHKCQDVSRAKSRTRWQKGTGTGMRALALALPWTYAIRVGHREGNHCMTSLKHDSRIHRSSMSPNSTNEIHPDKLIPIGFAVLHSSWVPPVPLLPFHPCKSEPKCREAMDLSPETLKRCPRPAQAMPLTGT